MTEYWGTKEAQHKSVIYSNACMSDRNGLGPHIHLAGPTSYQQIQEDMGEKLGRLVNLGEVFIKTHTKPDRTYVDRKAEKIAQNYQKNLHEKLSQLEGETSSISDGASRIQELTTEEYTVIFLQYTENDLTAKQKQQEESPAFVTLQEELKEAQRKIEEQATAHSRVVAELKDKLQQLSLIKEYLRQTDPAFLDFMAAGSASRTASTPTASSPPAP